ncbi:ectonucleotide pyrophosphatase/phosphodiesterase family member 7 [Platysternon megacephalum]|uniref:glutathione transferase n=1 Tax=Platysternon megacephalum TaxID=55544 RepID=A0A4D9EHC2_9SAUR|nr:ectonucleotide pyrophosphatase/phosphodiesterase family member 7 [Platysternon megacephalum]
MDLKKNFWKQGNYEKLLQDGYLLFQQVPMVEIDGMKMVQTRAILSYIAAKYNLYGKDLKERALIDMFEEGTTDLMGLILMCPFLSAENKEKQHAVIIQKATNTSQSMKRYHGQDFLVGNQFSWADVHLLEAILMVEEKKSSVLSEFPQLQAFKVRISNIPTVKKFLEPGSQRKPVAGNQTLELMAGKPKLYYFNGRGRMESIRWLLAAVGVEFEEEFLETREQYEKLLQDGALLFQQVPMVEIDGMKMVQTRAILSYVAGKHNLYGKDLKERAMYSINNLHKYIGFHSKAVSSAEQFRAGMEVECPFQCPVLGEFREAECSYPDLARPLGERPYFCAGDL